MSFARVEFGSRETAKPRVLPNWKQVHGTAVCEVRSEAQWCGEVDGLWTQVPGLPISVVTADCVPILLFNETQKAVAALHAGWRGTFQEIVRDFFSALPSEISGPQNWRALIGPSIRSCCYEVSEELIDQFKSKFTEVQPAQIEPSFRKLDLVEVNLYQLFSVGVLDVAIHPDCTYCKKKSDGSFLYHSYRRGDRNCRQYSTIEIRG